jgi:hypothetical protein
MKIGQSADRPPPVDGEVDEVDRAHLLVPETGWFAIADLSPRKLPDFALAQGSSLIKFFTRKPTWTAPL